MTNAAEFYDAIYREKPDKWADNMRNSFAFGALSEMINNPGSMLDVGCGCGHTLEYFRYRWRDTQYMGVDISPVALELAKERLPEAEFSRALPQLRKFDVITIMGVAEHFRSPSSELQNIGSMLAPGGYMYLEAPNCIAYSPDKTEGFRQTHAGGGQSEWHWHRDTWKAAIKKADLDILRNYNGYQVTWQFVWVLKRKDLP